MNKFIRKTLFALPLLASLQHAAPVLAAVEIKFGHVGEPGSLFEQSATEFVRIANEKLGDKAKVTAFGSAQLGDDNAMLKKLKLGTIDLALPSSVMSSVDPAFALFEMPYIVKDREHMTRIRKKVIKPIIYPISEKKGYPILGVWENGFRHITNSKRPIVKPEDLAGIKLRVPQGVWRIEMFKSYGANPAPLSFSEVFVALQTGVMDGQENPISHIWFGRYYEVQKYMSLSRHVYTPAYLVAGAKWKRLDQDIKDALVAAAEEVEPFVAKTAAQIDEQYLGELRKAGIEVNEVDQEAFVKASEPIYAKFAEEVDGGKDMIEQVRALRD